MDISQKLAVKMGAAKVQLAYASAIGVQVSPMGSDANYKGLKAYKGVIDAWEKRGADLIDKDAQRSEIGKWLDAGKIHESYLKDMGATMGFIDDIKTAIDTVKDVPKQARKDIALGAKVAAKTAETVVASVSEGVASGIGPYTILLLAGIGGLLYVLYRSGV